MTDRQRTPAAGTPVSSPQSGEGELLREALAFTFFKTRGHARYRTDADALFKKAKLPDAGNTVGGAFLREVSEAFADADIALAALTPAPRDQGSIQAASSASATVCDQLTTERADWNPKAIRERLEEGDGVWRTCSGCYECEDGYPSGHYPHSNVFGCTLGCGCGECGGIGAVWDTTDYANMAREISAADYADQVIANQKNLRGSEPETSPAGDASSRCDTGSKMK